MKMKMKYRVYSGLIGLGSALLTAVPGRCATVTQTTGDGFGSSSFNTGTNWSDSTAPGPGNDYETSVLLRSPSAGGNQTFAGDSLTLNSGGTFLLKGSAGNIVINSLIMNGGNLANGETSGYDIQGNISVLAPSAFTSNDGNRVTTVSAAITGAAQLRIANNDTSGGGNTTTYTLTGDNSGHSGGFLFQNFSTSGSYQSLTNIESPTALGMGTLTVGGGNTSWGNGSGGAITLTTNNPQVWNNAVRFRGPDDLNMGTGAISLGTASGTFRSVTVDNAGDTLTLGGVISNGSSANSVIKRGSGILTLTGANNFNGSMTVEQGGILSVPTIANAGVAQPLGAGTSSVILDGSGGTASTLRYTGGTASSNRGLSLAGTVNEGGIVDVSSGATTLTLSGGISGASAGFGKAGAGTLVLTGTGDWTGNTFVTSGTMFVNGGSINNTGNLDISTGATFRAAPSTHVRADNLNVADGGVATLEGGTLRVNTINLNSTGLFNWSAGTLATRLEGVGNSGVTDRTGAGGPTNGTQVFEGTQLTVNGDLTPGASTTVDLGGLYLNAGLRYDQLKVNGDLDLTGGGTTLNVNLNPYFLRPQGPNSLLSGDWGTMILAEADLLSGVFDDITGITSDGIGWSSAGIGTVDTDPSALALDTFYIEYDYTAGQLLFHYKVSGTVPEPGTFGLLILGGIFLRRIRRMA